MNSEAPAFRVSSADSSIAALNIEFVAKPGEAHKVRAALPAALSSAFGEVAGFAGSFVMIANQETRLVTVVTLWSGEDGMRRCNENVRWVRALLAPYLDRCLRVQTLAAYGAASARDSQQFEEYGREAQRNVELNQEEAVCVA
ncbi:MAG: hypothetical protein WA857_17380 [Candidatus Acidiferrum sp.]